MPRKEGPRARLCWFHPDGGVDHSPADGPNRRAAEAVVATLGELVADSDTALVTAFVMLAEAVDSDPTNAALWGQYRAAEASVREVANRGDDDGFSRLLAGLSAEVRDAEVGKP